MNGREPHPDAPELHPEDAADLRELREDGDGTLRQDISTAMVGLYKQHFGEGPTRCTTYLHPELVIVVLGGGYSAAEQTLWEAGKWHEVRQARLLWQDSMQAKFVGAIEELTGRTVAAFMSANRQDPDLAVEMFLLDAEQAS
ncbi:MAG: Na-translocating system protein MpsC family protein [Solirubrobacterales bacterium]